MFVVGNSGLNHIPEKIRNLISLLEVGKCIGK